MFIKSDPDNALPKEPTSDRRSLMMRSWEEFLALTSLRHINVIRCYGFTYDFTRSTLNQIPSLIFPWMENGTLADYMFEHPDADKLSLIWGIAKGLTYLHGLRKAVIHGDLRTLNILISADGTPCLTDFGLSRILDEDLAQLIGKSGRPVGGTLRWMAPELLRESDSTKATDVWAFAMTIVEIMTEAPPYRELKRDEIVKAKLHQAIPPERPEEESAPGFNDPLWRLCSLCWAKDPEERPNMREITAVLEEHCDIDQDSGSSWVEVDSCECTLCLKIAQEDALLDDIRRNLMRGL
ncbi:hypothetical protein M422DRAFT_26048 [Sphaerobolus stellatus SS14]|nr:hypothetical protein M422DRAFT_26048 [Sphaerobolus stellatus SS14]